MVDVGAGVVQAGVAIVTTLISYVAWVARELRGWIDEQETRTAKNETRSHANRRALDEVADRDATDLPPADDPATDRLGPIETDGGEADGSR